MSANAFEKTNPLWQFQQLQQQIGEWVELRFAQARSNLPEWSLPAWLRNLTVPAWLPKVLFWIILSVLVCWIAWQLWERWGYSVKNLPRQLNSSKPQQSQSSERTAAEWQRRSQKFYQQGNYKEAYRCLYMALLQKLNDMGIAPHELSRTDGEYLKLTQGLPQEELYELLLKTHEQLCFANAEISVAIFNQCQQAYGVIDS